MLSSVQPVWWGERQISNCESGVFVAHEMQPAFIVLLSQTWVTSFPVPKAANYWHHTKHFYLKNSFQIWAACTNMTDSDKILCVILFTLKKKKKKCREVHINYVKLKSCTKASYETVQFFQWKKKNSTFHFLLYLHMTRWRHIDTACSPSTEW